MLAIVHACCRFVRFCLCTHSSYSVIFCKNNLESTRPTIIMKVTITKAAKMAGVSRNTIYNDIDSGVLSFTSNARNKKLIDVSELARVYENVEFEDEKPQNKASQTVEKRTETLKALSKQDISAQVLQERLKATEKSLEVLNEERERERQNYESRLETLETALTKAQDGYNSVTKLLEDHRTKESGAGEWENAIKALESRISNQEAALKTELEETKKKAQSQIARYKQELEKEKNKSLWQKLFG